MSIRGDRTTPIYWGHLPEMYVVGAHIWYGTHDFEKDSVWLRMKWTPLSERTVQQRMKNLRNRIDQLRDEKYKIETEKRFKEGPLAVPTIGDPVYERR